MGDEPKAVLIVDDEPEVRKLVAATLGPLGYATLTASSGQHALAAYRNHGKPIELLITAVAQNGMSGPMLADRLAELQPGLKVLYMSGYSNSRVVQSYVVKPGHALLPKPFTSDDLKAKMQDLVARRNGRRVNGNINGR